MVSKVTRKDNHLITWSTLILPLPFSRYLGSVLAAGVVVVAIASPILMVVGHRIGWPPSPRGAALTRECGPECHALLLTLVVKLMALFGGVWAIFWKGSPATMPRIFFFRAMTLLLAFLAAFSFWLFYWVRFLDYDISTGAKV